MAKGPRFDIDGTYHQKKGNYEKFVENARSGIFIVTFEHISHLVLVFLLLTLNK